jgi:hypothetical protein
MPLHTSHHCCCSIRHTAHLKGTNFKSSCHNFFLRLYTQ